MPSRQSVAFAVYANGVLASSTYQPMKMAESAGAHRLDNATLEVAWSNAEFGIAGMEDFDPSFYLNTEIEIVRISNSQVVHWGKVTQLPTLISGDSGETLELVSRSELYLLGDQVDGYIVYDPIAADTVFIDGDLVFNPLIDGVIYGNMNDTVTTGAGCFVFLDPESVRTPAAQTLQGANVKFWSLWESVFYLLWSLNTPQTNIANPDDTTLKAVFNDPTALVQEVRIPRGTHLAQALDLLIEPLGYRWRIKRTDLGARTYKFFKKGTGGTIRQVYHQRRGSTLSAPRNLGETNVKDAGITFDIANIANDIRVRGGFVEYEITTELLRGWSASKDPSGPDAADTLARESPTFNANRDVMRRFVLNEAGDYTGSRSEITGPFPSALRTLLSGLGILGQFVARRRQMMPTMTQKRDVTGAVRDWSPIGTLNGVEVEYSNTAAKNITAATAASPIVITATDHGFSTGDTVTIDSVGGMTEANGTWTVTVASGERDKFSLDGSHGIVSYTSAGHARLWKPIKGMDCALLERECGVYFDGDRVPEEFFFDIANLKVRVTATIQSDQRVTGFFFRQDDSPNLDVVPLTLDLAYRFRQRIRSVSLSKYGKFSYSVSGATNATPIVVATGAAHGFTTGDMAIVNNAFGNTAANGRWKITVTDSTHFSLDGSVGNGAYTSGGIVHLENESTEIDDSFAITNFAASVRESYDLADISGPIQLEGLDNDLYEVGDRIDEITGKNVSFLARTGTTAYPQIIAIERDVESQLITLHLERQKEPIALPPAPRGNSPRFRPHGNSREFV